MKNSNIPSTQVVESKPEEHVGLGFKPKNDAPTEVINEQLKEHQIIVNWDKRNLMQDLHVWMERFNFEFKLKIDEIPAIMIDQIGRSKYGHFRPGRNGFGLCNEIAINEAFISEREYWQVLGTLLHELLHVEQEQDGKPGRNNYHNKAYKERALSLGLIVDDWGYTQYTPAPSPFLNVLEKYGVTVPCLPEPQHIQGGRKPGNSKLKLWICECKPNPVRLRVAIKNLHAKCLICNSEFKEVIKTI